jgi:hypothetical protein
MWGFQLRVIAMPRGFCTRNPPVMPAASGQVGADSDTVEHRFMRLPEAALLVNSVLFEASSASNANLNDWFRTKPRPARTGPKSRRRGRMDYVNVEIFQKPLGFLLLLMFMLLLRPPTSPLESKSNAPTFDRSVKSAMERAAPASWRIPAACGLRE